MATLTKLTSSLVGFKSALSTKCTNAEKLANTAIAAKNRATLTLVYEAVPKLDEQLDKLRNVVIQLIEVNPNERANYENVLTEYETKHNTAYGKLTNAIAQVERGFASDAVTQQRPNISETEPKILLKPFIISLDHSPADLNNWLQMWDVYYQASGFERGSIKQQQVYMRQCLEPSLGASIFDVINADTMIYEDRPGFPSCISLLKESFYTRYPVFMRRNMFFTITHAPNTDFGEFASKLHAIGHTAELSNMSIPEDLYVFRYIQACSDAELRKKFLNAEEKTLAKFTQIHREHSAQKATVSNLEAPTPIAAVQQGRSRSPKQFVNKNMQQKQRSPSRGRNNFPDFQRMSRTQAKRFLQGRCYRCGANHKTNLCRLPDTLQCYSCKDYGHLSKVCLKSTYDSGRNKSPSPGRPQSSSPPRYRRQSFSPKPRLASITMARARCASVGGATPKMKIDVISNKGRQCIYALPDTGASRSVIAKSWTDKWKIPTQPTTEELIAVNDTKLVVEGKASIEIEYQGSRHIMDVIVTSSFTDYMVVGWQQLMDLGVITKQFPNKIAMCDILNIKEKMLSEFKDVFGDKLSSTPLKGKKMHITLKQDPEIKPCRTLTVRQIPLHWQKEAQAEIDRLVSAGILMKDNSPSTWISPSFFVPKPSSNKLRLVTNFRALNEAIVRPVHPFPSPTEILSNIEPNSKIFCKLDLVQGYFQIALDEESSKLTSMLLPTGRYRYLRAPMGLNASGDEFCHRTDNILSGLPGVHKLVDDILITAYSSCQLQERIRQVLQICRDNYVTLSHKKFEISDKVVFAGYNISAKGVTPDTKKLDAIQQFPTPTCMKDVRSFLGLVNQLGSFIPNLSQLTLVLRELLKKDVVFQWFHDHQKAFEETKAELVKQHIMNYFDANLQTVLVTDASKTGLGYALLQMDHQNRPKVIQCGSRSLNNAEKNYAIIELECLAVAWGTQKCKHFLLGHPSYALYTDHRPLVGLFKKDINNLENARLTRFREQLLPYNFKTMYIAGKSNVIADALSRYPVSPPSRCNSMFIQDRKLLELDTAANEDVDYKVIKEAIQQHVPYNDLPPKHPGRLFRNIWDEISTDGNLLIVDNRKIIIPKSCRQEIIKKLHKGHGGMERTYKTAKDIYYWPSLKNDIKIFVDACVECQTFKPSQKRDYDCETKASYIMEYLSADLFEYNHQHYIVIVDRYSGFPFVAHLKSLTTKAVIKVFEEIFLDHGRCIFIRTDGGPQFRTEFKTFCDKMGITHQVSSPYNPQSNGHAESNVKNMKYLLAKSKTFDDFRKSLVYWRNTKRSNNQKSPSELFYGRRTFDSLPVYKARKEQATKVRSYYTTLNVGQEVRIQNVYSKLWQETGKIISIQPTTRSYHIQCSDGRTIWRNRRFIKPIMEKYSETNKDLQEGQTNKRKDLCEHHQLMNRPSILRRSARLAEKKINIKKEVRFAQNS